MYDAVLQQLTLLCQKGLLLTDQHPQLSMDGASWLVGLDLHLTRERMRELFRALEEKKRRYCRQDCPSALASPGKLCPLREHK